MSRLPQSAHSTLFQQEAHKSEQGILLHLITVEIPANTEAYPAATLHLVDANYDVTYSGGSAVPITYARFPLQFSGVAQSVDGTIEKATLVCASPDRVFQSYVERYRGLRGATVTVKTVYEKFVDLLYILSPEGHLESPPPTNPNADSEAYIQDVFRVDSYSSNENTITFSLDPVINLDVKVPRGKFYGNSCRWRYKDPRTCQYVGPLTTCKKDLEDCRKHIWELVPFSAASATITAGHDIMYFYSGPVVAAQGDIIELSTGDRFEVLGTAAPYTGAVTWESVATSATGKVTVNYGSQNLTTAVKLATTPQITGTYFFRILRSSARFFGGFPGIPNDIRRITL